MINRTNNLSFKGGYILTAPSTKTKEEFEKVIGKKKQIFNNFDNPGDVLYITRKNADNRVNAYLIENPSVKFIYYPNINTQCGFNDQKFVEAKQKLIAEKDNFITDSSLLCPKQTIIEPQKQTKPKHPDIDITQTISKIYDLDIKKTKLNKSGYQEFINSKNRVVAVLSPTGKYGISYLILDPKNKDESCRFLAVDTDGNKIYEFKSLDQIKTFKLKFKETLNHYSKLNS